MTTCTGTSSLTHPPSHITMASYASDDPIILSHSMVPRGAPWHWTGEIIDEVHCYQAISCGGDLEENSESFVKLALSAFHSGEGGR